MKIFTIVGMFLFALASLAIGQTTAPSVTPVGPPQQKQLQQQREMTPGQMQMLKQQDMSQRHQFNKLGDPSNRQFKCKYDSKRDEYRCNRRAVPKNK